MQIDSTFPNYEMLNHVMAHVPNWDAQADMRQANNLLTLRMIAACQRLSLAGATGLSFRAHRITPKIAIMNTKVAHRLPSGP